MDNNGKFQIDILKQDILNEEFSNENSHTVSKKKIVLVALPLIFIILIVIIVKVKYSFFNNIKNKVIASNFKCDVNYKLKNKKCILTQQQNTVLLGNINNDQNIDQADVDALKMLINSYEFSDVSYAVSDINRDGVVDNIDLQLLKDYVNEKINEYDIGIQKTCPMDNDISVYHLNKKSDKCIQVISKDANKKNEKEVALEEVDANTVNNTTNQGYDTLSTVITRSSNTVSEPTYDTSSYYNTNGYSSAYYNYSPYPSTHAYNYPSYDTTNNPEYDTSTSSYTTNYNPELIVIEQPKPEEEKNKSKILYSHDSLVSLKEVKAPNKNTEYNVNDDLSFELNIEQKGTGFYYYDVKTYYGSNDYNNGYLNSISSCQKLKTNSIKELKFKIQADDSKLIFNVYTDKDCRLQTLKSRYISSVYKVKESIKNTKLSEENYTINKGLNIYVLKPENQTKYNYRIRYSISNGKEYYVKYNEDCLKVIHGMNQLKSNDNNELDIYSDKKCNNRVKKIKLKNKE